MTLTKFALTMSLLFLAGISVLKCQVYGISGSKMNTACAGVIDHHSLEFEVLYSFEKSQLRWDHEGTLTSLTTDSQQSSIGSDLHFRATIGVFRNAEVGAIVDNEADGASLGFKWMPFTFGQGSVALAGGVRFGFRESSYPPVSAEEPIAKAFAIALLYSHELTSAISFDLNAGYNLPHYNEERLISGCLDLCGDFGWYLFEGKLQAAIGGGLRTGSMAPDLEKFRLVTLYPGLTVITGRDYEIMIALPRDIYGINHPKTNSIICALTITLR